MALSDLEALGTSAAGLSRISKNLYSLNSTYSADYIATLAGIEAALGIATAVDALTDDEVNAIFLGGRGTAEEITEAQVILKWYGATMEPLSSAVLELPPNDTPAL